MKCCLLTNKKFINGIFEFETLLTNSMPMHVIVFKSECLIIYG